MTVLLYSMNQFLSTDSSKKDGDCFILRPPSFSIRFDKRSLPRGRASFPLPRDYPFSDCSKESCTSESKVLREG